MKNKSKPITEPYLKLRCDDSLKRLKRVGDDVFHCMVTDPPAGVMAVGSKSAWDHNHGGRDQWIAWMQSIMSEAFRTLRPGSYSLVWTLPRTQHWTTTALENSGFEIVDIVVHLFPRSLIKGQDASKAVDNYLGLPRKIVGLNKNARKANTDGAGFVYNSNKYDTVSREPISRSWEGWRSNLKPAVESWLLIRKPLDGNTAENILKHETGGVRVGKKGVDKIQSNVVLSHHVDCTDTECVKGCVIRKLVKQNKNALNYFSILKHNPSRHVNFIVDDKIGRKERDSFNRHPTVKTRALMRFLLKLVCPRGGRCLDPFMGSGSTGVEAINLGFGFYGIEKDQDSFDTAKRRIENVTKEKAQRKP